MGFDFFLGSFFFVFFDLRWALPTIHPSIIDAFFFFSLSNIKPQYNVHYLGILTTRVFFFQKNTSSLVLKKKRRI